MTTEEKLAIAIEALRYFGRAATYPPDREDANKALAKIRPFTIDGPGVYLLRYGRKYRVLCIDAPGRQPVIGYEISQDPNASAEIESHYLDGRYRVLGDGYRSETCDLDIVSRA